ncbi:MAG: hypothetical protein GAK30_03309 [Paracidovorax wautersii]|uniref:Uncharacterized protein n=1 Tax=Paracidovorax wautersii TaxID=1177982 RepID=A0A7V8FLH4_9BURK|nr:MAG: hypothetical protein GAK30_03309 [Paracidovorax wautersii]
MARPQAPHHTPLAHLVWRAPGPPLRTADLADRVRAELKDVAVFAVPGCGPAARMAPGTLHGRRHAWRADAVGRAVRLDRAAGVRPAGRRCARRHGLAPLRAGLWCEQRGAAAGRGRAVHGAGLAAAQPQRGAQYALGPGAAHRGLLPDQHRPAALFRPGAVVAPVADGGHRGAAVRLAGHGAGAGGGHAACAVWRTRTDGGRARGRCRDRDEWGRAAGRGRCR